MMRKFPITLIINIGLLLLFSKTIHGFFDELTEEDNIERAKECGRNDTGGSLWFGRIGISMNNAKLRGAYLVAISPYIAIGDYNLFDKFDIGNSQPKCVDEKRQGEEDIYSHLDMQPAEKEDGWNTDPFELTEIDGKLLGRGSADDKGPVIAWIAVLKVLETLGIELPINIKFVLECMEESSSEDLHAGLERNLDKISDVTFSCISNNYLLGRNEPCLTGLRGICYHFVENSSALQDSWNTFKVTSEEEACRGSLTSKMTTFRLDRKQSREAFLRTRHFATAHFVTRNVASELKTNQ